MKKVLSLLLALAMLFALAACAGEDAGAPANSPAAPADDQPAAPTADASYDEVTLTLTVNNGENETAGKLVSFFANYVSEHSGGAVKIDPYYGGTLCSAAENLSFVGGGSVDMCLTGTSENVAELPLTNFPSYVYGSQQAALDYAHHIAFDNPETSKLIADEMAANNVVALGLNAGGSNAYFFKQEYTSLDQAKGIVLGCGANLGCYEALGFATTNSMPWDCYDHLSKGMIDCTTMAFGPGVGMGWPEVAPYVMSNGQYSFGNWILINADTWNGLSADTQNLLLAGTAATEDYSVELNADEIEAGIAAIENDYNGKYYEMSAADMEKEQQVFFEQSYADCRAAAASVGKSDEMEVILAATNEFLGINIQ